MFSTRTAGAIALAAALAAGPALAQSTGSQGTMSPGTGPGATGATRGGDVNSGRSSTAAPAPSLGTSTADRGDAPSTRNSVLTDGADVRASQVIGSSVYNDHDEKIGSIDDILMDKDHKATAAVVSVGGFLGLGAKLVEVPFNKLEFGDTRSSSDNKVKLPGASKDSLQGMPDYHYRNG